MKLLKYALVALAVSTMSTHAKEMTLKCEMTKYSPHFSVNQDTLESYVPRRSTHRIVLPDVVHEEWGNFGDASYRDSRIVLIYQHYSTKDVPLKIKYTWIRKTGRVFAHDLERSGYWPIGSATGTCQLQQ